MKGKIQLSATSFIAMERAVFNIKRYIKRMNNNDVGTPFGNVKDDTDLRSTEKSIKQLITRLKWLETKAKLENTREWYFDPETALKEA